jgi:hypothetical protein
VGSAHPDDSRDGIAVAALEPFRGYATALRTSLPAATWVRDAFHGTRLGFGAMDEVRRRVQQETFGHRGRRDDPLFTIQAAGGRRTGRSEPGGPLTWPSIELAKPVAGDLARVSPRTTLAASWVRGDHSRALEVAADRGSGDDQIVVLGQVPADGLGAGVQAGAGELLAQLEDQLDGRGLDSTR